MLYFGMLLAVEEAAHKAEEASAGGISAIGLDPKALLFQIINFIILFWILKKVAYKPVLSVLEERRKRIEESLKTAHEIELREQRLAEKQSQMLHEAREDAGDIVAKARMQTAELLDEAESKARRQSEKILSDARGRIAQEVEVARAGLKHELSGLVVAATEAVLEEKIDPNKDKGLIERSLQRASK
jgi:F-type H+-transporting ATPase subunit b